MQPTSPLLHHHLQQHLVHLVHSEWLLVALVDDEAALHGASAWGNAGIRDADAIALTRGSSADLVTIELEELLAGEAGR